ncbi:tripartite tricarboxylate transporter TctB family protein [Brevibacterium yomogidense]|uniref:tripartite tricarboxylate transporter TctB family protein n=1 Tax=Brevibacterium yomogidense TaxID=946573 RepID=UPI0018DF5E72|nr:tripartite tricarboxylate transporter TctB family protein [Brevibacterium yomogidense]
MNAQDPALDRTPTDDIDDGADRETRWYDKHTHRLGPLLLVGISIAFVVVGSRLDFGSISRPGPGLWPIAIATITGSMALVSALLPHKEEERFHLPEVGRAVALLVAFLLFPFLFDYVGFILPSVLLITFMMKVLSRESWLRSGIVAIATSFIAYVLFGVMLSVRLPAFTLPF